MSDNENNADEGGSLRRSRRERSSTKRSRTVLDAFKEARQKGRHRQRVDDNVENVYVDASDEDDGFIVDDDGNGVRYDDEEEDDYEEAEPQRKKAKKEKKDKSKKGTLDSMFAEMTAKAKKDESNVDIETDDVLNACLASITGLTGDTNDENACSDAAQAVRVPRVQYSPMPAAQFSMNHAATLSFDHDRLLEELLPDYGTADNNAEPEEAKTAKNSAKPSTEVNGTLARKDSFFDNDFADFVTPEDFPPPKEGRKPSPSKAKSPFKKGKSPLKQVVRSPLKQRFIESRVDNGVHDYSFGFDDSEPAAAIEAEKADVSADSFIETNEDGQQVLTMYWLDAFEDAHNKPGTVYLFGRVQGQSGSESCCVILKNIWRQLFFVKKEDDDVTMASMHPDIKKRLAEDYRISMFKCKPAKKFACGIGNGLPQEYDVMEVLVKNDVKQPPIAPDLKGETFTSVLNTTSTAMERLLVEQGIMGPCWLNISNVEKSTSSSCKHTFVVDMNGATKPVSVATESAEKKLPPTPPVRLVAFNVLSISEANQDSEIVMVSMVFYERCSFESSILSKPECPTKGTFPLDFDQQVARIQANRNMRKTVQKAGNEKHLLNLVVTKLKELDPDMIVGHDIAAQLNLLISRMVKHNTSNWHQLGRVRHEGNIRELGKTKQAHWKLTAGRMVVDSKTSAMELVRSRSYDIEELVAKLFPTNKQWAVRLNASDIAGPFFDATPKAPLWYVIEWSWTSANISLEIVRHLNAIPLFVQITQIVGGVLSRTLMGGRAERNEYLLLHAFHKRNYVAPDKRIFFGKGAKSKLGRTQVPAEAGEAAEEDPHGSSKKAQYTGGLVLDPIKGLYETYIVLLDFNSLYPSIMQEHNICFTTVENAFADVPESQLPNVPDSSVPEGILPSEIRELVRRRREVKALMKKCDSKSAPYKQYDIRQMGLKLTANSMYGCLGFGMSRFCAKTLAAMVTAKGRETLMHTKELVEKQGYQVIYGDTDSIMVNTKSTELPEAKRIGLAMKKLVNQGRRYLELDIDGVYERLLLLKKKKYAGLAVDLNDEKKKTPELKGLDIVRRDWSDMAKKVGDGIVNLILFSKDRDELVEQIGARLVALREALEADPIKIPLEAFQILKQLKQDPSQYQDAKAQAHVTVAKRLNESKRDRQYKKDDVIAYIICDDGTANQPMQRAYHISEIRSQENLKIDIHYYLAQQVHPIVSRLCEPIEEMDAVRIAEALGLETSAYRRHVVDRAAEDADMEDFQIGLDQDFNACEGFVFLCKSCEKDTIVREPVVGKGLDARLALEECSQCKCDLLKQSGQLTVCFVNALREQIRKYLQSSFECDEETCRFETSVPGMDWFENGDACPKCQIGTLKRKYTAKRLFDQQCFFKKIFDLESWLANECSAEESQNLRRREKFAEASKLYACFLRLVEARLELNEFNKVDLGSIFHTLRVKA
ncbi:DNA polymerase alpha catalytic subunit [Aphelenchoides avenae]|nr:DNA polymerase alpha catalytic subunit [Aphelenchus avenae]